MRFIADRFGSDFTPGQVRTTHYSEIQSFTSGSDARPRFLVKNILPWRLRETSEAVGRLIIAEINGSTLEYIRLLTALGVPVCPNYECHDADGCAIHVFPYIGEDLQRVLERRCCEPEPLIRKVLAAIMGVLFQGSGQVGIDPQLSNFCLDDRGEVVYVDVFPALCRYQGRMYVHYPNPTQQSILNKETERKFRPFGILRRLRFSLMSIDLTFEYVAMSCIRDVLGNEPFAEMQTAFSELPDHQVLHHPPERVRSIIEDITLMETDVAREMALRLVPEGPTRKDIMEEVFDLSSSFSSRDVDPDVRLTRLKGLLLSFL